MCKASLLQSGHPTWRMDTWTWRMDTWTWRMDTCIWRMDTILEGWTPYLTDGHPTWRMDTILDGWTPYLTDGHHIWRTVTLFDKWIFYFHELFICLIFSLLKEIPAFSDLYSFYCLTIIIYSFLKRRRLPCNLKYNQKFFMSLFRKKRIWSWIRYQYVPRI